MEDETVQRQRRPATPTTPRLSVRDLHAAEHVERLAYTRRQAAEALGISVATLDRRVVPVIETVKTEWGSRLIPVDELRRYLDERRQQARPGRGPRSRLAASRASIPNWSP